MQSLQSEECNNLEDNRRDFKKEINGLELQITQAGTNLNQILQNEKLALSYLDLFSQWKKILLIFIVLK